MSPTPNLPPHGSMPAPPPLPPGFATASMGPPPPPALDARSRIEAALAAEPFAPAMPPRPRRRGVSAGMAVWSVLGAAAVAYLSLVVTRPDLIARFGAPAQGPAVAEIETLRGDVDGLRRDVAEIRSAVTETTAQQKLLAEKVAALGAPLAAAPIPASDTGPPPAGLRLESVPVNGPVASPPSPRADAAPVGGAPAAKKIAEAKVLNATKPKPDMETGSVKPVPPAPAAQPPGPATPAAAPAAAEPPPFGPPVVTPAAKPVGVQIATGSSVDSLRLSWNLLSETHADKLKNLEPRYSLSVDGNSVVYNLMAGPVKSEAEAKKMCKALAAKAIPCKIVGDFAGAAL